MKKILLVGTYSGLNKGDRLMQQVLADQIRKNIKNSIVFLATPFPDIDKNIYKGLKIVKAGRRNIPYALIKLCALSILPYHLRIKLARKNTEFKAYLDADLIIDVSGDMLTEDYGLHVAVSHSIPLLNAFILRKKFIIAPQSIGPFSILKPLYLRLLSKACLVLCREAISYNYLARFGLSNMKVVGDLGFLLFATETSSNSIPPIPYFCLAPSGLLLKKFIRNQSTSHAIRDIATTLDNVIKSTGLSLILVPHVMTPKGVLDDDEVCEMIAKKMKESSVILSANIDPSEVKGLAEKASFMIAFRMHAAIAALSSGVPSIAVAYSHKTKGVLAECQMSDYVVEYDENVFENIQSAVQRLVTNQYEERMKLKKILPRVQASSKQAIDYILEEINA